MISDEQVARALDYLGIDPHPIAVTRYELTKAENAAKQVAARLALEAAGTVLEKESQVEIHPDYMRAKAEEAKAEMEFRRHDARRDFAKTLIELWRTEQANARAMEQVR